MPIILTSKHKTSNISCSLSSCYFLPVTRHEKFEMPLNNAMSCNSPLHENIAWTKIPGRLLSIQSPTFSSLCLKNSLILVKHLTNNQSHTLIELLPLPHDYEEECIKVYNFSIILHLNFNLIRNKGISGFVINS